MSISYSKTLTHDLKTAVFVQDIFNTHDTSVPKDISCPNYSFWALILEASFIPKRGFEINLII